VLGSRLRKSEKLSVTFRIDDNDVESLRKLAAEERISLNTLVNQILSSYLEWEFIAAKAGFAPMQKSVLKDLFDKLSEEDLKEIAIRAADSLQDLLLMMCGKVDLDAVILLTKNRVKRSGFTLREFDGEEGTSSKKLVMQHDVGHNWSVFSRVYIERLINNVGYPTKIESTDNSLIIEILDPKGEVGYTSRGAHSFLETTAKMDR
jgi:hypothetical protein